MSDLKPKILLVGLYKPAFGFTRVLGHIAKGLKCDFEVHYLGVGYGGAIVKQEEVTIYPGYLRGMEQDVLGIEALKNLMPKIQPEMVLLVHDLHWLSHYVVAIEGMEKKPLISTYIPMDGYLKDPELIHFLSKTDHCFVYTEFGKKNILDAAGAIKKTKPNFNLPPITVVPHGVDINIFYPSSETSTPANAASRNSARAIAFPHEELTDAFIVMNGNQPWPRKQLHLTIEGFAKFSRNKPKNVRLYLHHGFTSKKESKQIQELINIHGLQKRIIVRDHQKSTSESMLNHIYNACDVGINTSMGEGWGLVSFEHAATGAAQIVPRHTACEEIWGNHAHLLHTFESQPVWFSPLEMKDVSVKEVAQALEIIYTEDLYREHLAKASYEFTTQSKFQWKVIEKQWNDLMVGVLEGEGVV